MNEQELLLAVIGYIVATKKQPKSELEVQMIAKELLSLQQSDPQQYQQLVLLGLQALSGALSGIKAKLGAKLNYINKLKGVCPEDSEKIYLKSGGCMCKQKASLGTKVKTNAIKLFKKLKNHNKVEQNDTIHHNKQVYDLTGKHKLFKQLTNKEYRNLPTDKQTDVDNKDMMRAKNSEKKACGGKAKKHLYGGPVTSLRFGLIPTQKPKIVGTEMPEDIYNVGRIEDPAMVGTVNKYMGKAKTGMESLVRRNAISKAAEKPGIRLNYFKEFLRTLDNHYAPKVDESLKSKISGTEAQNVMPERINSPTMTQDLQKNYGYANVKVGNDGYVYHPAQRVSYAIGTNY